MEARLLARTSQFASSQKNLMAASVLEFMLGRGRGGDFYLPL